MNTVMGAGRRIISIDEMDILKEFDSDGIAMARAIVDLRHDLIGKQTAALLATDLNDVLLERVAQLEEGLRPFADVHNRWVRYTDVQGPYYVSGLSYSDVAILTDEPYKKAAALLAGRVTT